MLDQAGVVQREAMAQFTFKNRLQLTVIDFATGAIYFPPGKTAQIAPEKLREAIGADGKVDNAKLQAILESELGRSFPLNDPRLIQHKGSAQQLATYGLQPAA